jgi:CBS domain-containing membrane protein
MHWTQRWPRVADWCRALRPAPLAIDARERARVLVGAVLGLAITALLSRAWAGNEGALWLMAPVGASAVLVFAVPASPLAQPWAVLGGNTVSALAGLACAAWMPTHFLAAAVAPAAGIALMMACRCLHPPGGAVALLMVLTGAHDPHVALAPVALNSALLVLAGMVWNPATGRRYPHPQAAQPQGASSTTQQGFTEADLDAVLARYNQVLDVPRDDLRNLLEQSEWQAHGRRLRALRCEDVMSREPITIEFGTTLEDAWQLMQSHRIKVLPVVDRYGHIVGIVTWADFLRHAGLDLREGLGQRLRNLLAPTPGMASDKPEVVGQIMTRQVRVVSAQRPLSELVPVFASTGHHHIPVIGLNNKLVGVITQSDVVAALMHEGAATPHPT